MCTENTNKQRVSRYEKCIDLGDGSAKERSRVSAEHFLLFSSKVTLYHVLSAISSQLFTVTLNLIAQEDNKSPY